MIDLHKIKNIHFSGIKGVGMTALALYAQDMGKKITGSDTSEDFITKDILDKRRIPIKHGFSKSHITSELDLLIFSAARPENPQIAQSRKFGIPSLSYAKALALFLIKKEVIAVCGVGGKTSTSAMLATIMDYANRDPSFIVGVGNINNLGVPGRFSKGKYAVVEADDYIAVPNIDNTPKFLYLSPKIIIATNIEHDHPDAYPSYKDTRKAFIKFFSKVNPNDGLLIVNIDNKNVQEIITHMRKKSYRIPVVTYGFSPQADWRLINAKISEQKTICKISWKNIIFDLKLKVPGKFNALNATAALVVATHLGVSQKKAVEALNKFVGTRRRFEKVGRYKNIEVWDDYAHHPIEIEATLGAARKWFKSKRITTVFQPHTYSRTKSLLKDFSRSFNSSDRVIITQIYSSKREKKDSSISGKLLSLETSKHHPHVKYFHTKSVLEYLKKTLKDDDVLITLGAGNIYKIGQELCQL